MIFYNLIYSQYIEVYSSCQSALDPLDCQAINSNYHLDIVLFLGTNQNLVSFKSETLNEQLYQILIREIQHLMNDTQILTLSQIQEELIQSRDELAKALNRFQYQPLDVQNLVKDMTSPTIDEVLNIVPEEEQLNQQLKENKSLQQKREAILNYRGDYNLVNQFKIGIQNTKEEAVNIYYLLSILNPQNPKNLEQKQIKDNTLESWLIKTNEPNNKKLEYNMLRPDYRQYRKQNETKSTKNNLDQNDLLIHVIFYDSCNKQKQNEFICHGSQLLTQLRDRFYCLIQELQEKKPRNGSFFFINDSFYNDKRYGRENISQQIIHIASVNKVEYKSFSMQTKLRNIRVQIGKPYIWRHLGGCDHMIIFSEYRLFNLNTDILSKSEYPVNIFQRKINRRKCEGCKKYYAKIVAQIDRNKNGQDLYLCQQCHEDIHLQQIPKSEVKLPKYENLIVSKYIHE